METLKLHKFMRKVYRENREKRRPVRAMMELTYKCNHRCVHCYNPADTGRSELSTKEAISIIDQLADAGTLQIAFTGGEIFMRQDILDIVKHTRRRGLRVTLMTNGSLMTEEIADKLISTGVTRFEISFLGARPETFDAITGIEGSFDRVVSVVKMLRKKGLIPRIKTCVLDLNLDEVDGIADLAKELDVSFSYSPLVIPKLDLGQEPGSMRIRPDEFLDINKRFMRFQEERAKEGKGRKAKEGKGRGTKKSGPREEEPGFWERDCLFNCMAGHTGVFINPYGEVKSCMTVPEPFFDVKELGVAECWERTKEFVDTLKAPKGWECHTCEYNAWCSWCPGRGYLNTGDIFGCPPYFKELARERMKRYKKRQKKAPEKREIAG